MTSYERRRVQRRVFAALFALVAGFLGLSPADWKLGHDADAAAGVHTRPPRPWCGQRRPCGRAERWHTLSSLPHESTAEDLPGSPAMMR